MSLTLNDEQERALRNWYEQGYRPTEPECRSKDIRLAQAIAPLMGKWTCNHHGPGCGWDIVSGDASIYVHPFVRRDGRYVDDPSRAQHICDLLNADERRKCP